MSEAVAQPSKKPEETIIETAFGTVTTKRVIYFANKGWFSGGSREDIALKHVTSVRKEINRRVILGVIFCIIGLFLIAEGALLGIIPLIPGVLWIWGSPMVVVNTAGNDKNKAVGLPWTGEEAESFVDALRDQLTVD